MKKPRKLAEFAAENEVRFLQVIPYIGPRKPRRRPRSREESDGLAISTAEAIQRAYKTGALVKRRPRGFKLYLSKSHFA